MSVDLTYTRVLILNILLICVVTASVVWLITIKEAEYG